MSFSTAQVLAIMQQQPTMTTAQWAADVASSSPTILPLGVIGCEATSGAPKFKGGDGVNNWAGLSYISGGSSAGTLQQVLNNGNSAVNGGGNVGSIQLNDPTDLDALFITNDGFTGTRASDGATVSQLSNNDQLFEVSDPQPSAVRLKAGTGALAAGVLIQGTGGGFAGIHADAVVNNTPYNIPVAQNGFGQNFALQGDQLPPTVAVASAAGTGATVTKSSTADDSSGALNLTGGTGSSAGNMVNIIYNTAFPGSIPPVPMLTLGNLAAATLDGWYISSYSNAGFSIANKSALNAATSYILLYSVRL